MNRVFKTKWSVAHQEYVVTDEKHTTKTKSTKSAVALAVAAMMFAAGTASASFVDTSFVADNPFVFQQAKKSFETAEYYKNWGLSAMKASSAYALGYHGQGVKVGMMDSGFLTTHQELSGDRWHTVKAEGNYSQSGERYPQYAYGSKPKDPVKYNKGDKFSVDGAYNPDFNDNHGTGCAGVYAGNRDGVGMHGVAWGSEFYSANTGGTDDTNYGPFPDYNFFKAGYDALVASGVKIINNSFGTNLKQVDENGNILDYYHSGPELTTVNDIEYEYFLFKKQYNNNDADPELKGKSFVDAAWDAVKDKDVIQVFTNGNNDRANPYHRALYPYFNPEAEAQWIAIAGLRQMDKNTDPDNYKLEANFNEAGYAKYWTLSGPGQNGYTANKAGNNVYGSYSGTSMAAPFISGAFGVLASRYQDMSAVQVREVLLTTANHKNADGSDMIGWANADGKTPAEGEVSDRMGWGVPDLEKGMYGLGQFLGHFDYNLKKGHTDVWSNNITQVALEQREREDIAWLKSALKNADQFKFDGSERIDLSKLKFNISNDPADYKLTNTSTGEANKDGKEHNYDLAGIKDKNISLEDAKKWRLEYYTKRAEAIINKINGGLYDGSLTKSGEGTLVLTGDNDYDGKTTVAGGTLLAFSESIGTDHTVTVGDKGTFGMLSAYNDTFTQKGLLNSQNKDEDKLNIVIKDGGTLYIDGASDVKVQGVTFEGAKNVKFGLAGADHNKLIQVYNGEGSSVAGSFASDSALALEQSDLKKGEDFVDSLFFTVDSATLSTDKKKIEVSMKRDEGVTFQSFANGANQNSIASAIAASGNTLMGELLAASDKSQLEYVYSTLDDDFYVTARNALVTNATQVTRAVIDQASGMGEGRRAEFDEGRAHVWATGMGRWGEADGNAHSLDVDFTVGMVGAEFNVCQATKLGAFFGYGDTDYSGAQGKIDGEDKHFGIYGLTDIGNISMTYGIAYTDEDRDTTRHLGGVATSHSENASVLQGFVEGAYNFDLGVAKVSPYVGFTWARVETDDVVDGALDHNFKTEGVKDDIQIATIGARTSMPFTMGTMPVAVKADLGYSHFFGDSDGVARVQMGEGGQFATIEGSDLKGQVNFGLGIVGKVAKHATVGVSYTGAWGSDVDSHGIMGNLRINF